MLAIACRFLATELSGKLVTGLALEPQSPITARPHMLTSVVFEDAVAARNSAAGEPAGAAVMAN